MISDFLDNLNQGFFTKLFGKNVKANVTCINVNNNNVDIIDYFINFILYKLIIQYSIYNEYVCICVKNKQINQTNTNGISSLQFTVSHMLFH